MLPSTSSRQQRLPLNSETFSARRVAKRAPKIDPNQQATEIILRDPERYGGEDALAVRWARATAKRGQGTA